MNRREFIRHIALIAAGASALPAAVDAYEFYYEANAPRGVEALIAVDEVCVCGVSLSSLPLAVELFRRPSGAPVLPLAFNAFGGIVRWVAAPDQKILACPGDVNLSLGWRISAIYGWGNDTPLESKYRGFISYIDQRGVRQYEKLGSTSGILGLGEMLAAPPSLTVQ